MSKAKTEIADRLQALHAEAGVPSYGAMQRHMVDRLGTAGSTTAESIRRWHLHGVEPAGAPIEQLRVLCDFYGEELGRTMTLVDIHPALAARWDTVRRIAITSRYHDKGQQVLFRAA